MFQLSLLNPGYCCSSQTPVRTPKHKGPKAASESFSLIWSFIRSWTSKWEGHLLMLPTLLPTLTLLSSRGCFLAKQHELRSRVSASILANSADMSFMRSFSCLGHRSLQVHAQPKRKEGSVTRLQLRCLICWSLFSISASCRGMATRWSNKPQACSREIWANCTRTSFRKLQLLCS